MGIKHFYLATALVAGAGLATTADAALFGFQTFTGNVKNSNDGASSNDAFISASTEAGSTVLAAYLYTSTWSFSANTTAPTGVTLGGTPVSFTNTSVQVPDLCCGLASHRADVTDIVKPTIDGGPGGVVDFVYSEGVEQGRIDGSALVVVYENPSLPEATVSILDGFSASTGDQFIATFANPIDTTDPNFFAELALGIGFSAGNTQFSEIEVNGQLLTAQAGDFDDGFEANGGLITVGGFDDPLVSAPPATKAGDSERYDLTGFLNNGDTQITVDTVNPSGDDNIFLATFYLGGEATVVNPEDPDTPAVPLPLPAALLMTGMGALAGIRKLRHKA